MNEPPPLSAPASSPAAAAENAHGGKRKEVPDIESAPRQMALSARAGLSQTASEIELFNASGVCVGTVPVRADMTAADFWSQVQYCCE
jgi:hypothetical protein